MIRCNYFRTSFLFILLSMFLWFTKAYCANAQPLSSIASNAYSVLIAVPEKGVKQSQSGLEQLIADHHRLSHDEDPLHRQMALVLADAVAYAIVSEIQHAELDRMSISQPGMRKDSSVDKKEIMRLWKANELDGKSYVKAAMTGRDVVTSHASTSSSEVEILDGRMINKVSMDVRPRIRDLQKRSREYQGLGKTPSADESLLHALTTLQTFRDLRVVLDLFETGNLPQDRNVFRSTVETALKQYPSRRIDDGMEQSSLKVLSTFSRYCFPSVDAYRLRVGLLLGPYMADTRVLPDADRKVLIRSMQATSAARP